MRLLAMTSLRGTSTHPAPVSGRAPCEGAALSLHTWLNPLISAKPIQSSQSAICGHQLLTTSCLVEFLQTS